MSACVRVAYVCACLARFCCKRTARARLRWVLRTATLKKSLRTLHVPPDPPIHTVCHSSNHAPLSGDQHAHIPPSGKQNLYEAR